MQDLLKEYKKTRRETKKVLDHLKEEHAKLKNSKEKLKDFNAEELSLLHQYEEDLKIIRSWMSNLNYTIEWIRTGRKPRSKRGVERRSAYEREVPFDPYWIQLKQEETDPLYFSGEDYDLEKESLVKQIIKPLNKKEKEILELAANNFSIREIEKMLNVPKSTVHNVLDRSKKKIENEGWEII